MQVRSEKKRGEIMSVAARLFASKPFHEVRLEHVAAQARVGKGTLYVNGKAVGEGVIPHTVPARHSVTETFDIGRDEGSQVSRETPGLSRFPGKVGKVTFDVSLKN